MKRSSCLSSLLAGLSLTVACLSVTSVADAAAPKGQAESVGKKAKPGQVAKAAPATEAAAPSTSDAVAQADAQPSGGGTAPTTAPATGDGTATTTESTPAVSVGTTTTQPVADTPAPTEPAPAAKPKPRPWAGSSLFVQNSMTTATIFKGQTQDYNPTVDSSFWFLPRYAINEAFQLRGRMIVSYEYTNSDSTLTKNEPMLSDATLSLFYRKIPAVAGFNTAVALNVTAPTSKASRSRTMILSPGATLQISRPIEHFLGGEAIGLVSLTYTHPFYRSEAQEVSGRPEGAVQCHGGGGDCNNLSPAGTLNTSDTLSYMFLFSPEWGKWNPAVYYAGASAWAYKPTDVYDVNGQRIISGQSADPPGVRQTHYFSVWLDYNFNSWFTGEIGYWNSRTVLNENAKRANPLEVIADRYTDMRVYLGASIQLDNLVKALQGGEHGEAGVVRAKNQKTPMWTF